MKQWGIQNVMATFTLESMAVRLRRRRSNASSSERNHFIFEGSVTHSEKHKNKMSRDANSSFELPV